jgi:hypothetical protein
MKETERRREETRRSEAATLKKQPHFGVTALLMVRVRSKHKY